jgi:transposase
MDLTDTQWTLIAPLVQPAEHHRRRGRPWQDARSVLNGIFWVLRTGAPWADLPGRYPPHQTCHRRFRVWLKNGTLSELLRRLARDVELRSADGAGASVDPSGAPPLTLSAARELSHPRRRSWKWHTTLLLRSPIAIEALGAAPLPPAPTQRE